jgi:hypothetical protein
MVEAGATAGSGTHRQKGDGRLLLAPGQAPPGPDGGLDVASQLEEALAAVRSLLSRLDLEIAKARRSLQELEGLRARILAQLKEVAEGHPSPWGGLDPSGR